MRIVLGLEYDGSAFHGWQIQPAGGTVQNAVQTALLEIAGEPLSVVCAGRTDAGVHATGQVVHFDCTAERPQVPGCVASIPFCHLPLRYAGHNKWMTVFMRVFRRMGDAIVMC